MFNQFTIERVTNSFSNLIFYNDQLLQQMGSGTDSMVTYNAKPDLAKVQPYADIHKSIEEYVKFGAPIYAPLSVKFSQTSVEISYVATRLTIYEVMQRYGSYLAFCNFLVNILLLGF